MVAVPAIQRILFHLVARIPSAQTDRGTLSYTPSGGSIVNNVVYVLDQTEFLLHDRRRPERKSLIRCDSAANSRGPSVLRR